MARKIVLSNGDLTVSLDKNGSLSDLSFFNLGEENYLSDQGSFDLTVEVDDQRYSLSDPMWTVSSSHHPESSIVHTIAKHADAMIRLDFEDCISSTDTIFLRNIQIINTASAERKVRVRISQDFKPHSSLRTMAVRYHPVAKAMHYFSNHRYLLVSGSHDSEPLMFSENTGNASSLTCSLTLKSHSSSRLRYWIAAGRSEREVMHLHAKVQDNFHRHIDKTQYSTRSWLAQIKPLRKKMSEQQYQHFTSLLLQLRAYISRTGAIASTIEPDSMVMTFSPSIGASVIWPLLRLGYMDEVHRYISFLRHILHADGYLLDAYTMDGAPLNTANRYRKIGEKLYLPLRVEDTALNLFLIGQCFQSSNELDFVENYYHTLIKPMADFLVQYTDEHGMPLAIKTTDSVSTYTVASVYGALVEAVSLARTMDDKQSEHHWSDAASKIFSLRDTLYDKQAHYFYHGTKGKEAKKSNTPQIDSDAFFGVFAFGLFDSKSIVMGRAYTTLRHHLMTINGATKSSSLNSSVYSTVATLRIAQYARNINMHSHAIASMNWIESLLTTHKTLVSRYDEEGIPVDDNVSLCAVAEYLQTVLDLIDEPETTT